MRDSGSEGENLGKKMVGGGARDLLAMSFAGGSAVKNPPASAGNVGLIPELGRSPGEGNGYPLHYSCLGNLMDRGAWKAIVHRVAKELAIT